MQVYFSHGKESGPWGRKITRLADIAQGFGCSVESIDYSDTPDPDLRVERLVTTLAGVDDNLLLVGLSMDGYVALVASERIEVNGIFLLAPALSMPGYRQQSYRANKNTTIVHGWSDAGVPPENSISFVRAGDCTLHLISGDHQLNSSLLVVEKLFSQFLSVHVK